MSFSPFFIVFFFVFLFSVPCLSHVISHRHCQSLSRSLAVHVRTISPSLVDASVSFSRPTLKKRKAEDARRIASFPVACFEWVSDALLLAGRVPLPFFLLAPSRGLACGD